MHTPLPFLACPHCRTNQLVVRHDLTALPAPFDVQEGVRCADCEREYPYVQGVWVLWSDDIKALQCQPMAPEDAALQVKRANIQVYDTVAGNYGEHTQGRHLQAISSLKAVAQRMLSKREDRRPSVLVDVGCASGIGIEQTCGEFSHLVGVDISLQNLLPLPRKGVVAVLADAERLPFVPGAVDMITCFAAMHHFPNPGEFLKNSYSCLRDGGVCLTGGDPSRAAMKLGPIAKLAFELRRPLYRLLSRVSSRFHMHLNSQQQQVNDLAECQRTNGGFDPAELDEMLAAAGFQVRNVFYGEAPRQTERWVLPCWQTFLLKALSFQNPFNHENFASLSMVARK